jgi:hypothetical protein
VSSIAVRHAMRTNMADNNVLLEQNLSSQIELVAKLVGDFSQPLLALDIQCRRTLD